MDLSEDKKKNKFIKVSDFVVDNIFIILLVLVFIVYVSWLLLSSNPVVLGSEDDRDPDTLIVQETTTAELEVNSRVFENDIFEFEYPKDWSLVEETQEFEGIILDTIVLTKGSSNLEFYLNSNSTKIENLCEFDNLYHDMTNGWYRIQNATNFEYTKWLFTPEKNADAYNSLSDALVVEGQINNYVFCVTSPMYLFENESLAMEIFLNSQFSVSGQVLAEADAIIESIDLK